MASGAQTDKTAPPPEYSAAEKDARPSRCVLLIGRTGNGKSTVANLIKGEDVCEVGHGAPSKTTGHQEVKVDIEGTEYTIIDTIGIGDTSLPPETVLHQLAHAINACRDGIVQIFFVSRGRLTTEEAQAFGIMSDVLLNRDIGRFVTIVRTHFVEYDDSEACERDIAEMKGKGAGRDLTRAQTRPAREAQRIIHVDVLPRRYDRPSEGGGPSPRQYARQVLVARLASCQEVYNPSELQEINARIGSHVEKENAAERMAEQLQQQVKQLEAQMSASKDQAHKLALEMAHTRAQQQLAEQRAAAAEARSKEIAEMKSTASCNCNHGNDDDDGWCSIL